MIVAAVTPPMPSFAHDTTADELAAWADDIAKRRQQGEHLLSPLSFRQLEAMAQRLPDQTAPVRRILLGRLSQALGHHDAMVKQAREQAQQLATRLMSQQPDMGRECRRLLAAGDLNALQHLSLQGPRPPPASPLAELNRHIAQASQADSGSVAWSGTSSAGRVDMKSLRQFKDTWARMAAEDDVKQAIERGPRNAGPLNSHQLVLRSLSVMRDVSPDYLRRFMTHLDALLWLDQLSQRPSAPDGKPTRPAARTATKAPARSTRSKA
jgi:Protein of unknown function (DUF2894)